MSHSEGKGFRLRVSGFSIVKTRCLLPDAPTHRRVTLFANRSRRRIHFHGFGLGAQVSGETGEENKARVVVPVEGEAVDQHSPKTRRKHYQNAVIGPRTGGRRGREGVLQQADKLRAKAGLTNGRVRSC